MTYYEHEFRYGTGGPVVAPARAALTDDLGALQRNLLGVIALAVSNGRKEASLSQRALAERAGLSKHMVERLERDPRSVPLSALVRAMAVLGYGMALGDGDAVSRALAARSEASAS